MKYDSERDKMLDWMILGDWGNESGGDVNAPTGHFARITNEESDRQGVEDAFGKDMAACEPPVKFEDLIGHFLVRENDQGFVTVQEFDTADECERECNRLYESFDVWNSGDEEIPHWITDHPEFPQGTMVSCLDFQGVALIVKQTQGDWAECVMVGDDQRRMVELTMLSKIDREDFCGQCGQIGCWHDGFDRDQHARDHAAKEVQS